MRKKIKNLSQKHDEKNKSQNLKAGTQEKTCASFVTESHNFSYIIIIKALFLVRIISEDVENIEFLS